MAKNNFCYPGLPDEENIHNFHANMTSPMKELPSNGFQFQEYSTSWPQVPLAEFVEDKAASYSKSHRQAEKRRRDRINTQLARLRKLVPKSEKMDKAALLEGVVEQVQHLKKQASETTNFLTFPTETDEVVIESYTNINDQQGFPVCLPSKINKNSMLIKATFSCEDRPDFFAELIRSLKGLNLTTIRADITCLGGRMKSTLILVYNIESDNDGEDGCNMNISNIKQSLKAVLTRLVSWSSSTSNFRVTSKRQRFFSLI